MLKWDVLAGAPSWRVRYFRRIIFTQLASECKNEPAGISNGAIEIYFDPSIAHYLAVLKSITVIQQRSRVGRNTLSGDSAMEKMMLWLMTLTGSTMRAQDITDSWQRALHPGTKDLRNHPCGLQRRWQVERQNAFYRPNFAANQCIFRKHDLKFTLRLTKHFNGHPPPMPNPTDDVEAAPGLFDAIQQKTRS